MLRVLPSIFTSSSSTYVGVSYIAGRSQLAPDSDFRTCSLHFPADSPAVVHLLVPEGMGCEEEKFAALVPALLAVVRSAVDVM